MVQSTVCASAEGGGGGLFSVFYINFREPTHAQVVSYRNANANYHLFLKLLAYATELYEQVSKCK